ncbi:MAG TPA: glycogen debranching N-terminal domain-containing protein [Acidimicrobiales bacterium]
MTTRPHADRLFLHGGRSLLVTALDGQVPRSAELGFYYQNTRLLARLEVCLDDRPLTPFVADNARPDSLLAYAVAMKSDGLAADEVVVELTHLLSDGLCTRVTITNYGRERRATSELGIALDADFADLREAETGERLQHGSVDVQWQDPRLRFRYVHPSLDRAVDVVVRASGPTTWRDGALRTQLDLDPKETAVVELVAEPVVADRHRHASLRSPADETAPARRLMRSLLDEAPTLQTSNATVQRAWDTALADLAALPLGLEAGPFVPAAGVPNYLQLFGRDSLTVGAQAVMVMPQMLRDGLVVAAATQGRVRDDVELRGLNIGRSSVDVVFHRTRRGTSRWRVVRRHGPIGVVRARRSGPVNG